MFLNLRNNNAFISLKLHFLNSGIEYSIQYALKGPCKWGLSLYSWQLIALKGQCQRKKQCQISTSTLNCVMCEHLREIETIFKNTIEHMKKELRLVWIMKKRAQIIIWGNIALAQTFDTKISLKRKPIVENILAFQSWDPDIQYYNANSICGLSPWSGLA